MSFPVGMGSVNVQAYGAKGDGITDDTAAINSAVAAARLLGLDVYFPRPVVGYIVQTAGYTYRSNFGYRNGAITLDGVVGMTFYGDPGGSTLIMRTPSGGRAVNNAYVLVPPYATDAGTGAPAAWIPSHAYVDGNFVVAPNGHTYVVRGGGAGTSGASGPSDLTHTASNIIDGTVHWDLADIPYFGQMFRLRNDPSTGTRCAGIKFKNLILDGDAKRDDTLWSYSLGGIASGSLPYDYVDPTFGAIPAGAGYAAGHSAVAMDQGSDYGTVTFEDCTIRNWRSEIFRSDFGHAFADTITFRRVWFDSHTGNAVSCSSPLVMEDCLFTDAGQAIENDGVNFDQTYRNVTIRDGGVGFVVPSSTGSYSNRGQTRVTNMVIERCSSWGVFISGWVANVWIDGLKAIDNAILPGAEQIHVGLQFSAKPINVHLSNVEVGVHSRSSATAISFSSGDATCTLDTIKVTRTPDAINHGYTTGPAMVGDFAVGTGIYAKGLDFRQALTLGNGLTGSGEHFLEPSRLDGIYQLNAPDIDVGWHTTYEYKPGSGATTLSVPKRFPLGKPVRVVLDSHMTLQNNANIVLTAGANYTPGASGGEVTLVRPAAGSQRVVQLGSAVNY